MSSTDNAGGSGVKEVHHALNGAATGSQVVPGGSTTVTVSAEGTTTLTYFAVDNAGNQESAKTLTVRIDQTPPTVSGLPSSCSLWPPDHALVQVASVSARDGLSELAGTPTVTATANAVAGKHRDADRNLHGLVDPAALSRHVDHAGATARSHVAEAAAVALLLACHKSAAPP